MKYHKKLEESSEIRTTQAFFSLSCKDKCCCQKLNEFGSAPVDIWVLTGPLSTTFIPGVRWPEHVFLSVSVFVLKRLICTFWNFSLFSLRLFIKCWLFAHKYLLYKQTWTSSPLSLLDWSPYISSTRFPLRSSSSWVFAVFSSFFLSPRN